MLKAFIFPGQGSQYIGMGKKLYENKTYAKQIYHQASDILEYNLQDVSFNGPDSVLKETRYTQPALFVYSIILDKIIKNNDIKADAVAGHSLGEFSAICSAESISFKDALTIVKHRSIEMDKASKSTSGSMAAIIGADEEKINHICNQNGIVVPANFNSYDQVVISGEINAIEDSIITAKKLGVKRAIKLNVAGAFHSPLMSPAKEKLTEIINSINFNNPKIPIYQNISGNPFTDKQIIKQNLIDQIDSPILWYQTINKFKEDGYELFYEVGPGKVLNGLNRRIYPSAKTINCESLEDSNIYETL